MGLNLSRYPQLGKLQNFSAVICFSAVISVISKMGVMRVNRVVVRIKQENV